MSTSVQDIRAWLERGKTQGATHLIVVCDTFDHGDYPIFVMPGENARDKAFKYGRDNGMGLPTREDHKMSQVMEVYSLAQDWEKQLGETRAFHFD